MDVLSKEGTPKTPTIRFDGGKGIIEIKGRSIPENSIEFYKPLVEWIEAYGKEAPSQTQVNIQLEYFNTASSKCILDVFKKLEAVHKQTQGVVINWFYDEDDEDMLEAGQDYESIIRVPFKMIEVVG